MFHFSWRSLYFFLLVGVVCALSLKAERVEDLPKPQNYVNDFAHVLSPETERRLNALCAQVDHEAKAQIAVVTINTLDGDDIDGYTSRLEERWGVGQKGSDRGILMLFAIQDRKRRIEVGYGLEGILPDGKVGDIGRNMVPYLRAGNYDQAISLGVSQIAEVIAADAKVTLTEPQTAPVRRPAPHGGGGVGQLIFVLIFFFIIILLLSRLSGGGLLGFLLGMFLGNVSSRRRYDRDDWRGGGGFGGGGGGGGDSGFGGFGGGSSGGGGASGDW